jgi:hypothetical protein
LSISRAWDETRDIIGRDGKLFASVAGALMVLPGVVRDLTTPSAQPGHLPAPGAWVAVWLVTILVGLVGQLAIARLALAHRTSVGEAIGHSARRMPMYLLAQLIWVLPFAIGAVLLAGPVEQKSGPAALAFLAGFVLFVFVSIRMLLTAPIAVEEPALPHEIVKRSWKLSAGNWWRLFGFFLLFVIGAAIAILATLAVAGLLVKAILGELEPFSVAALLVSLASQIVMAGVYVLLMAMLARIYVQLSGNAPQASVPSSGT